MDSVQVSFRCCICLDTYSNPVSIPCGHNFCLACIQGFWDLKQKTECPLCKETFKRRPELRINCGLADITDFFRRSQSHKSNQEGDDAVDGIPGGGMLTAEEVPCDICQGIKSTSVKSCLVCQASYCQLHLTPHVRDATLQWHWLTDPATFPNNHLCRKHKQPLTMFCPREQMPLCSKCTEMGHRHDEIIPMEESEKVKTHLKETNANIEQMILARLKKKEEIKSSVDLSKKFTERAIQSSAELFTVLVMCMEKQQAELEEELWRRQVEAESRAEELLRQLGREVDELRVRSGELQQLELVQSPLHLLQSFPSLSKLPPSKEWSKVEVHSDNCMGEMRKAMLKVADVCKDLAEQQCAEELDKMNQYAVDVTLDPETASSWLLLSADKKKVSMGSQKKASVPHNPRQFDTCTCVLGQQCFTSGRHYWVVQVGAKTDWDLGLARESINRKGAITVRPDSGYWAICRRKGGSITACAGPSVRLPLQKIPQKVGIFLDYEDGSVSFYDAEAKTHIYTYSGCDFSEPLYPYFNPCTQDNGRNTGPLVICPLSVGENQITTTESV